MSDDPNDRAARLAGRWGPDDDEDEQGGRNERADGDGDADSEAGADRGGERVAGSDSGSGRTAESGSGDGEGGAGGEGGELTTREMQSQMLYLRPEFHRELDLTFQELDLRFRRERDRKLQKNRDFYAGLLRLGLDQLEGVRDGDLDEVAELLDL